jgi:hypothetical protein
MSESDEPGVLKRAYRTVTPPMRGRPDAEMDAIGLAMLAGLIVLLVPLLPFIVIVWVLTKLLDAVTQSAPEE